MNFLEYIFSVKNENKHKVITIFGIKIKFKRKYIKEDILKETTISVRELFLQQFENNNFNRFDTIVRLLAIENHYNINDFGWNLYRKMQEKRYFSLHKDCSAEIAIDFAKKAVEKFEQLIVSWEKSGYKDDSKIKVNPSIKLIDGSHRLALSIFHNLDKINLFVKDTDKTILYGFDWFVENDFTYEELTLIKNRHDELFSKYKSDVSICAILWAPLYPFFDEITKKLQLIYDINEVKDVVFSDDTYKRMVRAVYSTDDIQKWKIDKKIEYMAGFYPKQIRFINLKIDKPIFRFKKSNLHTILVQGEGLKRIFRNCYKTKIENYFYDICFHTCDNTIQSEFVYRLFHPELNFRDYLNNIKKFNYYIVKFESENMTKDFPNSLPFSKDLDVVVSKEDFFALKDYTIDYFSKNNLYNTRIVDVSDNHSRIRIELNGFLIYQIDITDSFECFNENFLNESFNNKFYKECYYLPDIKYELCYRMLEYIKYPNKKHHLDYIIKHLGDFDVLLFKGAISAEIYSKFAEIAQEIEPIRSLIKQ